MSVLVAGAGLAGLTAAYDLTAMGADVTVIEARERVGGRVWTIRDGFADRQHAEAGGDMIDEAQHGNPRSSPASSGCKLARILRGGFGYVRPAGRRTGRPRIVDRSAAARLGSPREARSAASPAAIELAERRWDSPITADLARRSVAQWLDDERADPELRATAAGLRGFFLADPEELSLLALVDQFAEQRTAGRRRDVPHHRRQRPAARRRWRRSSATGSSSAPSSSRCRCAGKSVHATLKRGRTSAPLTSDYLVLALPASVLRRVPITPALPAHQHAGDRHAQVRPGDEDAAAVLAALLAGAGAAARVRLAAAVRRDLGRQRGTGRDEPGILTLLAGGSASDADAGDGRQGTASRGSRTACRGSGRHRPSSRASRQVVWESDPLARGGYAFFDPSFDPALREWLARPAGRLFFAGEHTSIRWQGYMNGAVESGRRAAAEIAATARLGSASVRGGLRRFWPMPVTWSTVQCDQHELARQRPDGGACTCAS